MTISVVQSSTTGTFASGITEGNSVVMFASAVAFEAAQTAYPFSPALGEIETLWTDPVVAAQAITNGSGEDVSIIAWLLANIPADIAGETSFGCSYAANNSVHGGAAYEIAGLGPTPVVDRYLGVPGQASATGPSAGPTGAIRAASEIVFGGSAIYGYGVNPPDDSWTASENDTGDGGNAYSGYQIADSAGGTYEWSQTYLSPPVTTQWGALVFSIAAALPSASGPSLLMASLP